MTLIIPTAASSYADSSSTSGHFRQYVLAQFRSDADLEWVRDLRGWLVREELKWKDLVQARPALKKQRDLWNRVLRGVSQATIVVISPEEFEESATDTLSPEAIELAGNREKAIIEGCATAVVASTPIAYLPSVVAAEIPWSVYRRVGTLEDFTPAQIRGQLGGGLKSAVVFAARAHATFDLPSVADQVSSTTDVLRKPLSRVALAELLATQRNFDEEHPKSARLLNRAADAIADAFLEQLPVVGTRSAEPLVREVSSRAIDEVQAADIAAGWAREMLELGPVSTLGSVFERVWSNGKRIK